MKMPQLPDLDRRHDVGLQRVAHHHAALRPVAVAGEDALVGGRRLVADDLHRLEQLAEAGARQLLLLVEQVALGDQQDAIALRHRLQRLAHVGQDLDRMRRHVAAEVDQVPEDRRSAPCRRSRRSRSRSWTGRSPSGRNRRYWRLRFSVSSRRRDRPLGPDMVASSAAKRSSVSRNTRSECQSVSSASNAMVESPRMSADFTAVRSIFEGSRAP